MPPKRKYLTHRQEFIEYSAHAFKSVQNESLSTGRTLGRRAWNQLRGQDSALKDAYIAALDAKHRQQEMIDELKPKAQASREELDNLLQVDVARRDNAQLLTVWDALYTCRRQLHTSYGELVTRSRNLKDAIDAIYTSNAMQTYSQQKHDEVTNAHAAAWTELMAVVALEAQFGIPLTQNGERKILEEWLPTFKAQRRDLQNEQRRRNRFNRSNIPTNDRNVWHGGWQIPNQGAHSRMAIWMNVHEDGLIVDRLLRKYVPIDAENWTDVTQWQYPTNAQDEISSMEWVCNKELASVQSTRLNQSVDAAKTRGHRVDVNELSYTINFAYCPYGDMVDLLARHKVNQQHIPEPFLWRVFLSLAVAGLAMEKGSVNSGEMSEDWPLQIVHRDLKPENLFLDLPTKGHFESYPTVRLGDFGIAIKTHTNHALNPLIFRKFRGTPGFEAPEQHMYVDLRNGEPVQRWKQLA